jgi:anthranilate synthase component 1
VNVKPALDEFLRLAENGARVPLYAELLADLETPTSAYWKIAHDAEHSFLLESVTGGESLARYSFLGANPTKIIREKGQPDPLKSIKDDVLDKPVAKVEGLPRFTGGAVGCIAYDAVRQFERLPENTIDDLGCDDVCMLLVEDLVAFDHAKNRMLIIAHASGGEEEYKVACERIESLAAKLKGPLPPLPKTRARKPAFIANMSRDAYEAAVRKTVEYIEEGDGVQMVISQRFTAEVESHPLTIYRSLRSINPSPYMYLLRLGTFDVIGASPEILVTCEQRVARVRPIAGTRPRGKNESEDARLEKELLADEKERAEHVMLVDLGRNDIGRIAKPGTVAVNALMTIEKYSHVIHIVSDVTGLVNDDLDCFDVFRACFPAGTVSGAPKVRAMEIIEELEPTRRGVYAGAVGYFGFNGDMDMAIAIRTILLKDGKAHIQAGAGIVFDSVPEKEWEECKNKAAAVIKAVEMAESGELQ